MGPSTAELDPIFHIAIDRLDVVQLADVTGEMPLIHKDKARHRHGMSEEIDAAIDLLVAEISDAVDDGLCGLIQLGA